MTTPVLALSVEQVPVHRPHAYVRHEKCMIDRCAICDGGLALCSVCGALEGALLDGCPGVQLTAEQHEWNRRSNLRRWRKEAASSR